MLWSESVINGRFSTGNGRSTSYRQTRLLFGAERYAGLLPTNGDARAQVIAWMFAAVDTVKAPIVEREAAVLLENDKPWQSQRLPVLEERIRVRLGELSSHLGDSNWLAGEFSAADIMMATLLRRLSSSGLLQEYAKLSGYVSRGEARPAFKRAFEAQLAVFNRKPSAG